MIKIVYIVSTLERTGPTNQLSYIIKHLDKSKYLPYVITLSPDPEENLRHLFKPLLGDRLHSLNLSRIGGVLKIKGRMTKLLNEIEPDILHTQGIRSDCLAASVLKKYKCIATIRNYAYKDYPESYGKIKGSLMAKKHLECAAKIDYPIAVSKYLAKNLKNNYNIKAAYIRNGIDTDKYFPVHNNKKVRKQLNLPINKRIFISAGILNPRKDPLTIIKAFKQADLKNGFLLFLGDGPLKELCKQESSNYPNIRFEGNVSNVNEYLQAGDYFISSALSEGLPNSVMEAFGCGLPALLSDIPSHKEMYEINKNASKLFETKNVDNLAALISHVNTFDYEDMKSSALYIINNYLNAKTMSKSYQKLYKEIYAKRF